MSASNNHLHSIKVFDKRAFCWDAVQMLPRFFFRSVVRHVMPIASTWVTVRMRIGWFQRAHWSDCSPSAKCLMLAGWCKTVINVCSFSLLISSPIFSPTSSPNCLLYSLSLNNSPPLPFLSLPPLIFLSCSLFPHSVSHPVSSLCFPLSLPLCPTGVRAGDDISILQVHPHHHGKSLPILPLPLFCLLLFPAPPLLSLYKGGEVGESARERLKREVTENKEKRDEGWGEEREREKKIWRMSILFKDVWVQRWRWWQTWCALLLLPPDPFSKLLVFSWLFDILPSPSTIWINVSLYAVCLIFYFFLYLFLTVCTWCTLVLWMSSVYISVKNYRSHFHQPLFPLHYCLPLPCCLYPFFSPSIRD